MSTLCWSQEIYSPHSPLLLLHGPMRREDPRAPSSTASSEWYGLQSWIWSGREPGCWQIVFVAFLGMLLFMTWFCFFFFLSFFSLHFAILSNMSPIPQIRSLSLVFLFFQQEQFGVGVGSTNHGAWQWEVYSAVSHHQASLSCCSGEHLTWSLYSILSLQPRCATSVSLVS